MSHAYHVPDGHTEVCYEIKKSRFIARLQRVSNREEAMAFLDTARLDYPDARHHCWAYQLGTPNQPTSAAMSDDGEPSGTAGKPILNVIQHKDLGDVMVIIIRYFGGIKLGAGGLVRAYSQASQMAFEETDRITITPMDRFVIDCDFASEHTIRHWLAQKNAEIVSVEYAQHVQIEILLEEDYLSDLEEYLAGINGASIKKLNA